MDQRWYKCFNLIYQPPLLIMLRLLSCLINLMLRLLSCLINLRQQSIKYTRIDIVYDVYYKISIKNATREKHGRGFRYTVTGQGKIPKDWKAFLNISENKIELFAFLTVVVTHMLTCPILVHLIIRRQTPGCSLFIHVKFNNVIRQGHTNVMIWTVDSDVQWYHY